LKDKITLKELLLLEFLKREMLSKQAGILMMQLLKLLWVKV
jgi:hypothetical protein